MNKLAGSFYPLVTLGLIFMVALSAENFYDAPISIGESVAVTEPVSPLRFDLSAVEHSLRQIPRDNTGDIIFNQESAVHFGVAAAALATLKPADYPALVSRLYESFPTSTGNVKAEVLINFLKYNAANTLLNSDDASYTEPESSLEILDEREALIRQYFGRRLADKLFGRELFVARALAKVQLLEQDQTLSETKKAELINDLLESLNQETSMP